MKHLLPIAAALLCSAVVLSAAELRQSVTANREWRFQLGDTAKERTDTVQNDAPSGRFVRVTFAGTSDAQAAALAEMELTGTMNQQ